MRFSKKEVNINYPHEVIDIVHSNIHKNIIYGITSNQLLLNIEATTGSIVSEEKLTIEHIKWEKPLTMHLSSGDQYLAIVRDYGSDGVVIDMQTRELVLTLNRKDYYAEQTKFPLAFFEYNGSLHLIHATDWNHIDVTDLATQTTITQRSTNKHGEELYLDYFYGELHLSPGQQWFLSSGWVWQPVSAIKFINLEKWLAMNKSEPETDKKCDIGIWSYYWDRALCWINDHTIAYLYAPKEEGLDDDEVAEMQLKKEHSYILVYDILTAEITQRIVFDDYPKDEHYEAPGDCLMFFDRTLIISSKAKGTYIVDIETETVLLKNEDFYAEKFNRLSGRLYNLSENNSIEYAHR